MRSLISLLMMVVMVLAPCAVAHAATSTFHRTASPTAVADIGHGHAKSNQSHGQKSGCHSENQTDDRRMCPGDCDTVQRVSQSDVTHRTLAAVATSSAVLIIVLTDAPLSPVGAGNFVPFGRLADLRLDSKSVLRMTARLRL